MLIFIVVYLLSVGSRIVIALFMLELALQVVPALDIANSSYFDLLSYIILLAIRLYGFFFSGFLLHNMH